MSAYGKVSYNETDTVSNETVLETIQNTSAIENQVNKFDTSYAVEKLQELYNEYDKIVLDESKIKSYTTVQTNAVSKSISFRSVLVLSTTVIVTLLLAFLCIYNIFVINNINSSITYLQEEVTSYEYEYTQAVDTYNKLTSMEGIQQELAQNGYKDMASSNIVAVSVPEKTEVIELQGETNWFDQVCNFLGQIFG